MNLPRDLFTDRLKSRIRKADTLVCAGLDPNLPAAIPESPPAPPQSPPSHQLSHRQQPTSQPPYQPSHQLQTPHHQSPSAQPSLFHWGTSIIDHAHPFVCAFKPNLAFYEAHGSAGIAALEQTMDYLRHHHPEVPVIGDAKRGDIASTAEAYAKFLFDRLGFDAVTLNPYLGSDSLTPFLERPDRGCIIVCRTSNPSADDLQTADVGGVLLWQRVLEYTADKWNSNNNCLAVIGGTRPDDLRIARQIAGKEMFFLVPGIGAQGADLEAVLAAGLTKMHNNARDRERDVENGRGEGLIINSSRAIATKPAEATKNLRDKINSLRA